MSSAKLTITSKSGKTLIVENSSAWTTDAGTTSTTAADFASGVASGPTVAFTVPYADGSSVAFTAGLTNCVAKVSGITPSPNKTTVTTVGPAITDAQGAQWTLTASGQVAKNGVADASTSNVVELAYVLSTVWQLNKAGLWYSWTNGAWSAGLMTSPLGTPTPTPSPTPTPTPTPTLPPPSAIKVVADPTQMHVMNRQGINLSVPTYYDGAQFMAKFSWMNGGFERIHRKFLLNVVKGTANSATDGYTWDDAPANYFAGLDYYVLTGPNYGKSGLILSSTSDGTNGHTYVFDQTLNLTNADRVRIEGDEPPEQNYLPGWWINGEWILRADPRPGSFGGYSAYCSGGGSVSANFDSSAGARYITLNGSYSVTIWAKADVAGTKLTLTVGRTGSPNITNQSVSLTTAWQQYTFSFTANETQSTPVGTGSFTFSLNGSGSLDDVDAYNTSDTVLLKSAYLAKLLSGNFKRLRVWSTMGFTPQMITSPQSQMPPCTSSMNIMSGKTLEDESEYEAQPIAWPDAITLALTIGVDEIHLVGNSCDDVAEYVYCAQWLFGDETTPGGKARAALGIQPVNELFSRVILSFGNEQWNAAAGGQNDSYDGENWSMIQRYQRIAAALKALPFIPENFVFTATIQEGDGGSQYGWMEVFLKANPGAPVEINQYIEPPWQDPVEADAPTMLAEMWKIAVGRGADPTDGTYGQWAALKKAGHAMPEVYEHGMNFVDNQNPYTLNYIMASQAAALTVAARILSVDKTFGTQNETFFCAFQSGFNANGGPIPLWGATRNVEGNETLDRPVWLMLQLLNTTLLACPNRIATTLTSVPMNGTTPLVVDALLTDGKGNYAYLVINYDVADHAIALPLAPKSAVAVKELWAANLTDTNESSALCVVNTTTVNRGTVTARKGTMTIYSFAA